MQSPLISGEAARELFAGIEPKLLDEVRRLLAKRRGTPGVRVEEYVRAQASATVREAVERLCRGRRWRYVPFAEFMESLRATSALLMRRLLKAKGPVCFVIDDLGKSSFFVLGVALHLAREGAAKLFERGRVHVALENEGGGLRAAFQSLPDDTTLVLSDDATYSGEQLSYLLATVQRHWRETHSAKKARRVVVHVPYMSAPSLRLFKSADVIHAATFPSLLYRRSAAGVLADDVYLVRRGSAFAEYQSLYFDFLGLMSTNTLMIFEHKVADGLSIPHRWLHLGPCVGAEYRSAYKVRPERAKELAALIEAQIREADYAATYGHLVRGGVDHREVSRRAVGMMHSRAFRDRYMTRVALEAPATGAPRNVPLLSPEFCDERYRRFMERHIDSPRGLFNVPDCRRPPYQRTSYKHELLESK
jgi:hypothetical protein